jgi:hypothetical protein
MSYEADDTNELCFVFERGKTKNKEWRCKGCGGKWKCAVGKLRAHILCIKGRNIKPCNKCYTAEELQPMKDLEQQLAQATAVQERAH